jgi:hypothetical protein
VSTDHVAENVPLDFVGPQFLYSIQQSFILQRIICVYFVFMKLLFRQMSDQHSEKTSSFAIHKHCNIICHFHKCYRFCNVYIKCTQNFGGYFDCVKSTKMLVYLKDSFYMCSFTWWLSCCRHLLRFHVS